MQFSYFVLSSERNERARKCCDLLTVEDQNLHPRVTGRVRQGYALRFRVLARLLTVRLVPFMGEENWSVWQVGWCYGFLLSPVHDPDRVLRAGECHALGPRWGSALTHSTVPAPSSGRVSPRSRFSSGRVFSFAFASSGDANRL